jgi:hypothetical protein
MNKRQIKKANSKTEKYWRSYWIAMAIQAFVDPPEYENLEVAIRLFYSGLKNDMPGVVTGHILDLAEDIGRTCGAGFKDPDYEKFIFVYRRYTKIKRKGFSVTEMTSLIPDWHKRCQSE